METFSHSDKEVWVERRSITTLKLKTTFALTNRDQPFHFYVFKIRSQKQKHVVVFTEWNQPGSDMQGLSILVGS